MTYIGGRDQEGVDSWYNCEVHSRIYFSTSDVQFLVDKDKLVEMLH